MRGIQSGHKPVNDNVNYRTNWKIVKRDIIAPLQFWRRGRARGMSRDRLRLWRKKNGQRLL
jgi:hypothetical protein